MGQRDIRRLLMIETVAVVRWAVRWGAPEATCLGRMTALTATILVAAAFANRLARAARV